MARSPSPKSSMKQFFIGDLYTSHPPLRELSLRKSHFSDLKEYGKTIYSLFHARPHSSAFENIGTQGNPQDG